MDTRRTDALDRQARRKALKLHTLIAREVAGSILSGHYQPGALLDGEVASCLQRQVSRTTYREAMKIVMAKGMVTMVPGAGTKVTASENWHWLDPEVSSWLFEYQSRPAQLHSLFELRRSIEPEAASLAATRRSREQLVLMEAAILGSDARPAFAFASKRADEAFWSALYRSTGNVYLSALGKLLTQVRRLLPPSAIDPSAATRDVTSDYRRILSAIAAADAEGARKATLRLIRAEWKHVNAPGARAPSSSVCAGQRS